MGNEKGASDQKKDEVEKIRLKWKTESKEVQRLPKRVTGKGWSRDVGNAIWAARPGEIDQEDIDD